MAFFDFAQPAAGPSLSVGSTAQLSVGRTEAMGFAGVEWRVIGLARHDGMRSLREPGRLDRLRALLFGRSPDPRLASPRLEALRRLAVEAWHKGYAVSLLALADFRKAGFTKAQLELLLATISAGRTLRNRRSVS
ncbi:hypothetical protein WG907_01295 [Sphingobium sp. AN558]|uniref:hypothetical protein n=1 Tax=Sphingobium sp. AN558 TaxID=3133442 RepID=UPI0030C2858A